MKTFLLALCGVIAGILLLLAFGWFWLKRKLRGVGEALGALAAQLSGVPPFRITLKPLDVASWSNDALLEASASLESAGYQRVDDFEVEQMQGVRLRGFWHPGQRSYAVVYDHPQAGVFVDVVGLHTDRSLLTVSSAPETGMDRPERSHLIRMPLDRLADAHRLHERLVAESAGRTPLPTTAGEFCRAFEGAYRMEQNWRIARGGVTADEVRRAAAAGGLEPPDECAIELVQAGWRAAIDEFVSGEVLKTWLASNPMPAAEWEEKRERIRVVHDHGDAERLSDELAHSMITGSHAAADEQAEQRAYEQAKTRLAQVFSGSVCAGFAEAQRLLPEKRRFQKLGAVARPFAGDLYLEPEHEAS